MPRFANEGQYVQHAVAGSHLGRICRMLTTDRSNFAGGKADWEKKKTSAVLVGSAPVGGKTPDRHLIAGAQRNGGSGTLTALSISRRALGMEAGAAGQ